VTPSKGFAKIGKIFQKRKGSTLTITILMLTFLNMASASLYLGVRQNSQMNYHNENMDKATLLAEAGISEAYALLKEDFNNKNNPSLFPETTLGEGSYDVTIIQTGGRVLIESLGKVKNVENTVSLEVKQNITSPAEAFEYAFFSNGTMEIKGNSNVTGDTFSNDNVLLDGNADINGIAKSAEEVELDGNSTANSVEENLPPIDFPTFDFNYYYNLADPTDRYSGDQTWDGTTLSPVNGVIYVNGKVIIKGDSTVNGTIVATGAIEIEDNYTQSPDPDMPALMSRDDTIKISANAGINSGMVYSALGDIYIYDSSNLTMTGHLIAFGNVFADGNINLTFETSNPPGRNGGGGALIKVFYAD